MNQLRNLQSYYPSSSANGDPTHEYIDAVITNNSTNLSGGSIDPIPVVFNQIKTSNIIDDCSKYYLSVIRWSVETSLPVIIPKMELTTTAGAQNNRTEYYVNMIYIEQSNIPVYSDFLEVNKRQVVLNLRTDATITPPTSPVTVGDYLNNPYYYIDSVQGFLENINNAYALAFTTLKNGAGDALKNDNGPVFTWDATTGKICLAVTQTYVRENLDHTLFMSMSTSLYNLLNTFNTVRINSNVENTTDGADYVFNLTKQLGLNEISSFTGGTQLVPVYKYYQESSSVPSWSPVSSLVFVTNSIPVNATHSGIPQFQAGGIGGTQVGSSLAQNATTSVLTDFEIPMETGVEYRNISYYSPTSEYRLFDFVSNQQLNNLNISIFWRDKYGHLHPLTLRQNASASIKLLLRKKDFNGL